MTKEEYETNVCEALDGCELQGFGLSATCPTCRRDHGYDPLSFSGEFDEAIEAGIVGSSPELGGGGCWLCGQWAVNRYPFHFVNVNNFTCHSSACGDCMAYLTNGTIPNHLTT